MASCMKQYLTAVNITLAALAAGTLSAGSGYLIRSFRMPRSEPISTADVLDLIASSHSFGLGIGAFIALLFLKLIGRKKTLMLAAIPCIQGWIVIIGTNSYSSYIYIEFIIGVAVGLLYTVVPIYIAEISPDEMRGSLGCLLQLMFQIGLFSAHFLEHFISYQVFAYIFLLVPILMVFTYKWLPDTPADYQVQYNDEDEEKSLKVLQIKGKGEGLNKELENLTASAADDVGISGLLSELWRNRKSLLVMAVCAVAMHFSIIETLLYYNLNKPYILEDNMIFFKNAIPISILITTALGILTVDWIGRRSLLLFCSIGVILSSCVSEAYFFMKWNETNHLTWILTLPMFLSIFSYGVAFNTITFVLLGELFPTKIKDVAALLFVLLFAIVSRFDEDYLIAVLDIKYMLLLNIVIMTVAGVVIYYFLPETKRKSLTEIQLILHNRSDNNEKLKFVL